MKLILTRQVSRDWLSRYSLSRSSLIAVLFFSLLGISPAVLAVAGAEAVLLVPGISTVLLGDGDSWGAERSQRSASTADTPMLSTLQAAGYRYGGIVDGSAVADSESGSVAGHSPDNLFVLRFSAAADNDGLAFKGLELAQAISVVRRRSGASKVTLVAYSAGGLVARAYLQGALPGLAYRGDVDRLITIATPHMGAELAASLGDWLGTQVHALRKSVTMPRRIKKSKAL